MGDDREAGHSKHKSKDKHRDRDRSDSKPRREDRNGRDTREAGRRDKDKVPFSLRIAWFVIPQRFVFWHQDQHMPVKPWQWTRLVRGTLYTSTF